MFLVSCGKIFIPDLGIHPPPQNSALKTGNPPVDSKNWTDYRHRPISETAS